MVSACTQGQILISGVAVAEADVEAKNGCLYSLVDVLIPPSIEPILPHRCDVAESNVYKVRINQWLLAINIYLSTITTLDLLFSSLLFSINLWFSLNMYFIPHSQYHFTQTFSISGDDEYINVYINRKVKHFWTWLWILESARCCKCKHNVTDVLNYLTWKLHKSTVWARKKSGGAGGQ